MPPDVQTAQPRCLTDAVAVQADPDRYAAHPSLVHLSRLMILSAAGHTPRQAHRPAIRPAAGQPAP